MDADKRGWMRRGALRRRSTRAIVAADAAKIERRGMAGIGLAVAMMMVAVAMGVGCARMEMPGPQGLMRVEVISTGAVHAVMVRGEDGGTTMTLVKDFPAEQKNIWWAMAELGVKALPAVLTVLIAMGAV